MELCIHHSTELAYSPGVEDAWHVACLTPRDTPTQLVLQHQLTISPQPQTCSQRTDPFGNTQHHFALHHAHHRLVAQVACRVQTRASDDLNALPQLPWLQLAQQQRYHAGEAAGEASGFLHASALVQPHDTFVSFAQPAFTANTGMVEACSALCGLIHHAFQYQPNSTHVQTQPQTVLHTRQGVCQDFAHVVVAVLRSMGLAARYVSGYLLTHPPPGQPRLIGADATHAWAQAWLGVYAGQALWLALDPTNNRIGLHSCGQDYVTLAVGRDYADVPPLKGVLKGALSQQQRVEVTVQPMPEASQAALNAIF